MLTVILPDGTETRAKVGRDFVLAGNATLTIQKPDGTHRTYRVRKADLKPGYADTWFVSLLTGPDNTSSYTYLGKLDPFTGQCVPTAKSGWTEREPRGVVVLLNRVLARVWSGDHAAFERHGYRLSHAGKCGRCGRTLTVPASIESGIGPECAKHVKMWS